MKRKSFFFTFTFLFFLSCAGTCFALQADEILLIVNRNNPSSIKLAEYYCDKRQIPPANLLTVKMTDQEDCSHEEYQRELLEPLRKYLTHQQGTKIRCLLLFYGIPLRVAAPELSQQQWRKLGDLKHTKKQIDWQLENRELTEDQTREREQKLKQLEAQISKMGLADQRAAVDSEISLALNDSYPLAKWQPNPFFVGFQNQQNKLLFNKDQVLFVSRLDGPTPEIVRRMIDDSLYAEKNGLQGQSYFDARWPLPEQKNLKGYALYDASIHKAAQVWCKRMLEEGVAATVGPVAEPYVQGFPLPELFFSFLLDGYYTLAESYFLSMPYLSWQMILIGDPLYRPFRNVTTGK